MENPVIAENLAKMKRFHEMKKEAQALGLPTRAIDDITESAAEFITICMIRGEQGDYYASEHFQAFIIPVTYEFTRCAAQYIAHPSNHGDADAWYSHVMRWPNFRGAVAEKLAKKIDEKRQRLSGRVPFDHKGRNELAHAEEILETLK